MSSWSHWVEVCATEDVPLFEGRRTKIKGVYVGVFRTEEGFYAIGDACPHMGGPLSDGIIAGTEVSCPLHNRRVALRSGEMADGDLSCRVPTFPVEIRGGMVYLDVSVLEKEQSFLAI